MNPGKLIFSTDLHGKTSGYRAVMRYAAENGIKHVVFGGDISPKKMFFRFKDGTILTSDKARIDSTSTVFDTRIWFDEILRFNEIAKRLGGQEQFFGVDDSHMEAKVRIDFERIAKNFNFYLMAIAEHLKNDVIYVDAVDLDRVRTLNPNTKMRMISDLPEAVKKDFLEKVVPRIRKKMERWISKKCSDEEIYLAYMQAAGEKNPDTGGRVSIAVGIMRLQIISFLKLIMNEEFNSVKTLIEKLLKIEKNGRVNKQGQRLWIKRALLPEIASFNLGGEGRNVYIMPGNDDYFENLGILERADAQGIVHQVHGKLVQIGAGYQLGGYSFVSNLPTDLMQDWAKSEEEILADLKRLFGKTDQKKTILSIHAPPYGGTLDMNYAGHHIGSAGVAKYLTSSSHQIALTGHVHEVFEKYGIWNEYAGGVFVINPGAKHDEGINAVVVDIENPAKSERLVI